MIKGFLKDSTVIKIGEVKQERKLQLDVFGKLDANVIDAKIIEIAKAK